MSEIPQYLTVAEVAKALKVSKMTIYRMIEAGEITYAKFGRSFRIPEEAFKDYIDGNTIIQRS